MIYLNNAATTYPKPTCVYETLDAYKDRCPQGQYRSTGDTSEDIMMTCRKNLGRLFHAKSWESFYFTSGATEGLNRILSGLDLRGKQIVTTVTEHNSVLRPLLNLEAIAGDPSFEIPYIVLEDWSKDKYKKAGMDDEVQRAAVKKAKVLLVPCDHNGYVLPENLLACISEKTGLVVLCHCSNVTGRIQDVEEISRRLPEKVPLLLDASQSSGCIDINVDDLDIDFMVATGHKGLFGPTGTGFYYVSPKYKLRPMTFGGTGRDSRQLTYGRENYEYEVGTQNTWGLYGLNAGLSYILEKGVPCIRKEEEEKMDFLVEKLIHIQGINLCGREDGIENYGPVLSFRLDKMKPQDAGYVLQNVYDIVVRVGLHCAPLIHEFIGSGDEGTIRLSLSDQTSKADIGYFVDSIRQLAHDLNQL